MPGVSSVTKEDIKAGLALLMVVAEIAKEAKGAIVPLGPVYAAMMDRVTCDGFARLTDTLVGAGLIVKTAETMRWVGPND